MINRFAPTVVAILSLIFAARAFPEAAEPEAQGVSSSAVSAWLDACDREMGGLHGFVLLRHGKLVAEGWWSPYRRDEPHLLFSHSKSFTSTAAGFAVDEGLLDLDERVADVLPDKLPAEKSENLLALRVRDLLTMNAGTANGEACARADPSSWTKAYLSADFSVPPGTKFRYDSLATHLVAAIVERKTKRPLLAYLDEKLFRHAGMTSISTTTSPEGVACGGWGMSATTRDLAAFGQFYLQEGRWNGRQLLSKDWVRLATAKQTATGRLASTPDWAIGYGFQFWRCQNDCYRADGAGGQFTIVMPEKDAVLSVTSFVGNYQKMLDTVWKHLYPGLADGELAANPKDATALKTRCARLALPMPRGARDGASAACGAAYRLAANPLGLKSVRFDRTAAGWRLTVDSPLGEQALAVGHGAWERSAVRLTRSRLDTCSLPIGERTFAAAGAWTAPDAFACDFHMTSGPAKGKITLRFDGDVLTADVEAKAACWGSRRYLLTGIRQDGDNASPHARELKDEPGEGWFGGATVLGGQTPFGLRTGKVEFDQTSFALYNQAAPLMLSTRGRWVWSDEPLVCSYANGTWRYRSRGTILSGTAKEGTLAGAYAEVSRRFFPPSGRAPDELFVRAPQYNTWIELGHDQTQEKILAYARDVVTNGFPAGVLMIDHGWQREFGDWRFRPEAFPDPKGMMDELHALGFRTLLWVVPFVSTNAPAYAELKRKGALLADGSGAPAPITWWSGTDAVLDLREKAAGDWFRGELKRLAALGADGFKLDGGDPEYYDPVRYGLPAPARDPECARQSELWARLGLEWPFNELRATWKCGGLPLVERLCDKGANMAAVRELIPSLVNLGLMGHPFACPDMIGGGMLTVFRENKFNPEVYVRSAQVHALSPMMQFSASPWRRLDAAHLAAVRKAVAIRQQHADYLVRTMRESAKTGLPMIRSLEFVFPGRGYACVNDQFMLGEDLMVAPQMKDGARERTVRIPPGTWRADDGTVTTGPCETTVSTPLDRLPHYERVRTAVVKCPDAFTVPKPGAVKPTGWLREWAQAAAKGATGRMEEVDEEFRKAWAADFTPRGKNLNWFNGTWSCEGGAYWFDGLVRLAYQLDDPGLKALARRRLDPVLDHMTETPIGFCWWLDRRQPSHFDEVFASSDWMVNWVAGMFARPVSAWYAATGDPRAARALDCALGDDYWNRGFSRSRDVAATPGSVITIPSGAMEAYRITGSGKIAAALETYARDYAAHPRRETYGPPPFKGIEETMNLKRREQQGLKIPLRHGVVANESLLSLFTSARVTGDAALMRSWREWMKLLDTRARLPYGATVMDEEWGHPGPRRGTETCALAAELWSRIHYLAALGEAGFADDVERGFFNAAPAAVTRDWREHVYFQTPNRLSADDSGRLSVWHQGAGARRQVNYAPKHDPLCCTAGLNRLVPEYVQAMWMTTADGGVAAALYGPCTFETELAGGRFAAEERTDYPFGETVEIAVTAAPGGKFPLAVRVPGWCGARAEISVNGEPAKGLDAAGFVRLERTWKAGDAVRLRFPMAVRVETAVDADETHETFASVLAGPLLFAKGFAEKSANEPAEKTFVPVLDTASAAAAQLTRKPLARPWNWPLDAPVKVTVRDAAGAPLELVPYGCTKLRASMLRMADSPVSKHQ